MTPQRPPDPTAPTRIDWLSDADIVVLLSRPAQCQSLFGHPDLLFELQLLIQINPTQALWYRPAASTRVT
ncbi:hypothetical protein [Saccharospirillum sp.]|uniref:hypothetical protein n=1 Tax=Saccharospirillum sp. TaxID=2033801 RepID=UPI0034A03E52